ncbi:MULTISPECIES: transglutaminase-like cysteine peptidase [unclassified Beijerinckia]|uniref:transglutaminase-like cysteine peptidase n=1 Tax=unclassified Beijerinckia TaxID=2638183 RepID=UPI000895D823|nr:MULTISPECIES: transglutaminase-like cysteine peptidase [unclassified Beijerinckia]MDH7795262.1 putative transglutaminase-like cysteine proteinase [Beijerinckia sp. GAS462]SEB94244.1 Predicted transglutaminase-like cysteine proteinase [Beijerinckia sp. 28-YEA-48]
MFRSIAKIAVAAAIVAGGYLVTQSSTEAQSLKSSFIAVGSDTLVPYGWVDFCKRYTGECATPALPAADVNYTAQTAKLMKRINSWVNNNIKAKTDQEHWGVVDRWDYPTDGVGDCEDFVLLKRRLLIEEGFPRQGLLVTVVKDERGEGHAVLTVKTSQGEFILDNLVDDVKPWTQIPYKFVKRQSQTDPNVWVDIGVETTAPLVVSR